MYKISLNYHPRGDLISHLVINSLKIWKQLRWINIKSAKASENEILELGI
jgi:hypothetical protein